MRNSSLLEKLIIESILSLDIVVSVECRHFNRFGDQREGRKGVGDLGFGEEVVVMHDQTVELG